MAKAKKLTKTQQRVICVLENMKKMAEEDDRYAEAFSELMESGLNDLRGDDFFGTEGQLDPRGDGRDSDWSMSRVQDIDG